MTKKFTRREFFKLTGVGAATAVLTGCGPMSRYVVRRPYTDMPEYNQTGVSTYYATACRECPAGCGLIVRTQEGRAIKAEGNPNHPVNRGKICSRGLTAVQGLYNPDRIKGPLAMARGKGQQVLDWNAAIAKVGEALGTANKQGVAFLLGLAPDHLYDFTKELTSALGAPEPVRYGALGTFDARATLVEACKQVFGKAQLPFFDMGASDVTFAFGADFLETWLSPLAYSRAFSQLRKGAPGRRGYLVSFEPRMSLTSGSADEWIPLAPGSEGQVAAALGRLVAERRGSDAAAFKNVDLAEAVRVSGVPQDKLEHLAELFANAQHPLAIAGGGALGHVNGLANAKAILALDVLVGSLGKGGVSLVSGELRTGSLKQVQDLVNKMRAGQVEVLFIHGVNPVFELPASLGFEEALAKVKTVISFSSFPDETALKSDFVFPDHSALESFGYQRVLAGADRQTWAGSQPVVAPLYDTRATLDVLLAAAAAQGGALKEKLNYTDEVDYLQKQIVPLIAAGGFYTAPEALSFWAKWLQSGGWWPAAAGLETPDAGKLLGQALELGPAVTVAAGQFYLVTFTTQLSDGSGANRPWLQETPDPMTTVTWNSWVEINPATAKKLDLNDDDIVKISSSAGEIEAIVYRYPAIRPDTIALPFGQGHQALGRYAEKRGANPARLFELKTNPAGDLAFGDVKVTLTKTGQRKTLSRVESREGVYGKE
jgi:anaerobic selenocysteine-containing dehydrogenase